MRALLAFLFVVAVMLSSASAAVVPQAQQITETVAPGVGADMCEPLTQASKPLLVLYGLGEWSLHYICRNMQISSLPPMIPDACAAAHRLVSSYNEAAL